MNKILTFLIALLLNLCSTYSQGVYQLWGMTYQGGSDGSGTVFSTNGNNFQQRLSFSTNLGKYPESAILVEYNGKFYGTTSLGGNGGNNGVIFEWDPTTNTYTKKVDLNYSSGGSPYAGLTLNNGKFYGVTRAGGNNGVGAIFEWDPLTNIYTKKIDMVGTTGGYLEGSLIFNGTKFYGMTSSGGSNSKGVIFEWDPLTNIYTKKIDLSSANGSTVGKRASMLQSSRRFTRCCTKG